MYFIPSVPFLLSTITILLHPSVHGLGINCRGSHFCGGVDHLRIMDSIALKISLTDDRAIYTQNQRIACLPSSSKGAYFCAFLQGNTPASGVTGAVVKQKIQQLRNHGCLGCGSVPFSGNQQGILKVDYLKGGGSCDASGLCSPAIPAPAPSILSLIPVPPPPALSPLPAPPFAFPLSDSPISAPIAGAALFTPVFPSQPIATPIFTSTLSPLPAPSLPTLSSDYPLPVPINTVTLGTGFPFPFFPPQSIATPIFTSTLSSLPASPPPPLPPIPFLAFSTVGILPSPPPLPPLSASTPPPPLPTHTLPYAHVPRRFVPRMVW